MLQGLFAMGGELLSRMVWRAGLLFNTKGFLIYASSVGYYHMMIRNANYG